MDFSQSHSPFVSSLRQIAYGNQNKSFPAKDFSSPSAHFLVQAKCACGMFPTATMAELSQCCFIKYIETIETLSP